MMPLVYLLSGGSAFSEAAWIYQWIRRTEGGIIGMERKCGILAVISLERL
jgi:hypothetical protein